MEQPVDVADSPVEAATTVGVRDEPSSRSSTADRPTPDTTSSEDPLVDDTLVDDTLIEEISIDGMCGVY